MQVVGVRGSGETANDDDGFGSTVKDVVTRITSVVPGTATFALDYPAVAVGYGGLKYPTAYKASVADGKIALGSYITQFLAGPCGSTTYLYLIGYSQGAHVVGDVYESLGASGRARVGGVVLIGDPRFNGGQPDPVNIGDYSPKLNGVAASFKVAPKRVVPAGTPLESYCTKADPICNWSVKNGTACSANLPTCPHLRYTALTIPLTSITYTRSAGNFLITRWRKLGPAPATVGPKSSVLIYGDNDPTDGDPSGLTNLESALGAAGFTVTTAATLPSNLSSFGQVWHYGVLDLPTAAEADQLVTFVGNGGSLFLTGEWDGCCSTPSLNDSVRAIFDRLVVTVGGLTVGPSGYGRFDSNPAAILSAAHTPNELTTLTTAVGGSLDTVNLGDTNVLFRDASAQSPAPAGAGLWDETSVIGGGRLAIVMDVNWAQTTFGDMTTMPGIAANIAYFLSGNPATVGPISAVRSFQPSNSFTPAPPGRSAPRVPGPRAASRT